jgi:hypothetical protein
VIVACRAISAPQSQVNDRRMEAGRPSMAAITASVTLNESAGQWDQDQKA